MSDKVELENIEEIMKSIRDFQNDVGLEVPKNQRHKFYIAEDVAEEILGFELNLED